MYAPLIWLNLIVYASLAADALYGLRAHERGTPPWMDKRSLAASALGGALIASSVLFSLPAVWTTLRLGAALALVTGAVVLKRNAKRH